MESNNYRISRGCEKCTINLLLFDSTNSVWFVTYIDFNTDKQIILLKDKYQMKGFYALNVFECLQTITKQDYNHVI